MKSSGRQRRSRKYEEDVRERRLTPRSSSLLSREGNVRQFYRRAFCILHAHLVWRVSGTNRRYRENRQPDNFSALNVSIGSSLAARNAGTIVNGLPSTMKHFVFPLTSEFYGVSMDALNKNPADLSPRKMVHPTELISPLNCPRSR